MASSGSSSASRWVAIDLLRLARQRFPAYVQVQPIGLGANGEALWTARQPDSPPHVFAWRNGKSRDLGSFGQPDDVPVAVNDRGQIAVSRFFVPAGLIARTQLPPPPRAFLWQNGQLTDLGTLGGKGSFAVAINDQGEIAGWSSVSASGRGPVAHAFLWRNGKLTDLGTLGGLWSEPTAIDDRGEIVGSSATRDGSSHAFLWRDGKMTDLGTLGGRDSEALAINEHGEVLGLSSTARSKEMLRPFVWRNGKTTELGTSIDPDRLTTTINESGVVTGTAGTLESPRGFVWQNGKVSLFGKVAGQAAEPTAMNDRGQIVGGTVGPGLRSHAFLWQHGFLTRLPSPRLALTPRVWISQDGKRILAVSEALGGLRRKVLLWTRKSL